MKTKLIIILAFALLLIPQVVLATPAAPSNITVTGISDTTANISWTVQNGANQYEVFVNGQQWTSSNNPGAILQGLQANTQYSVYVVASDTQGDSSPSPSLSFMTLPPIPTIPEQPTIKNLSSNSITMTWQPLPAAQVITAYRIYLDGQAIQDVQPVDGMQTVILTDLTVGSHTVSIAGLNANKEGPQSPSAKFDISALESPMGLTMFNHNDSSIWISWQPVKNADSYTVLINGNAVQQTDQTKCTLTDLQANTSYQVQVLARSQNGNQSSPANLQVSTLPKDNPLNAQTLTQSINSYVPYLQPFIIALFCIVGSIALARQLKYSIR